MRALIAAMSASFIAGAAVVFTLPATAQEGGLGTNFTGLQLDGDQPISIESSTLDVDDRAAIATFTGNVSVAQGPTQLRTGKLVVHYNNSGGGQGSPAGGSSALPGGSSSIERLEASNKVYVKSEDQVATAERASFDMASNIVVMTGDVVLSQGDNVAEGCRLTIQMDTGKARLESSNCDGSNPGAGGRVRMMLTPGENSN
ncbi:LptA/OstA family protein [Fulvimarina sp. MAC3]|uniref:LptA/OstA family protein n=1 Tax=Fulvimarina sp. MAC3 TaxID=3148887 RepID=UPI0031FD5133